MIAIITVVIKTWLDRRADAKKHIHDESINEIDLGEMLYIQDYLDAFRHDYEFDRVSISQFHNGGKFFNGKSMKKFSVTYESCAPGISKIKREYQNLLVSEFPKMFSHLFDIDMIIVNPDCEHYQNVAKDMALQGIVQNVVVPIRGLKGDLLGFISCHNIGSTDERITNDLAHTFADMANQISGYLAKS
jgi:hypothetical protein